jgi:hypothetical protein
MANCRHNKITFAYVQDRYASYFSSLWLAVLVFLESPKRILKEFVMGHFVKNEFGVIEFCFYRALVEL